MFVLFFLHVKGKIIKRMGICDYCHSENEYLFDIFKPDYSSILFRFCHICNINFFLCPLCLNLRDRDEEYVNGYCTWDKIYSGMSTSQEKNSRILVPFSSYGTRTLSHYFKNRTEKRVLAYNHKKKKLL